MADFPVTTHARFWSKVDVGNATDCWHWQAGKTHFGYGKFGDTKAHRISWEMFNGPIPDGLMVCHKCDNPRCVNPAHLFVGTAADNNRDRTEKGRSRAPRGERHPNAKLSDADVRAIRASSERGIDLAERYGVAASTISEVRSYRWRI